MQLVLIVLGLTACNLGADPGFPGGGSQWSGSGDGDDTGDTGVTTTSTPVIEGVDYDFEDYPNSDSGWLLNIYISYSDLEDDLEGGEVLVWLGDDQLTLMIDSDAATREAIIEDGQVYFGLDIEQGAYDFELKLKDAAGNGSEKFAFSTSE
jgi:hypothetical protein